METPFLTRAYLETLSSSDLIALADDYDIDIPENLNRRFIIGELLDVAEELNQNQKNEMIISGNAVSDSSDKLPDSYNETNLTVMFRNPVWVYVYWDISSEDLYTLRHTKQLSLLLHVSFYEDTEAPKSADSFDIQVAFADREQYILIPPGKKVMRIDLVYQSEGQHMNILASSKKIELIHGCEALSESKPGKVLAFSPIMELSGINDLLRIHYIQHRQSFTE